MRQEGGDSAQEHRITLNKSNNINNKYLVITCQPLEYILFRCILNSSVRHHSLTAEEIFLMINKLLPILLVFLHQIPNLDLTLLQAVVTVVLQPSLTLSLAII